MRGAADRYRAGQQGQWITGREVMNRYRLATIGAAAVSALSIGVGATSAAGAPVARYSRPSQVQVSWDGTLGYGGHVVTVGLTVLCNWHDPAPYVEVRLTQKTGGGGTTTHGVTRLDHTELSCTNTPHAYLVTVFAWYDDGPFKQGSAHIEAELHQTFLGTQTDAHRVQLKKR